MKILYIDIETAPNLSYIWGQFEQNAIDHLQEWTLLGFAYAWNDGPVHTVYPPDTTTASELPTTEVALLHEAHALFEEADVVIAHNGDRFDIRKMNAKFIEHNFPPPAPYLSVDTKKIASRVGMFNSNSLDNLGSKLGLGKKMKHEGWPMWEGCLAGEPKWWKKMAKYNKRDITLLRDLYKRLQPWDNRAPNFGNGVDECSKCGSKRIQKRGTKRMRSGLIRQTLHCQDCGGYSTVLKSGQVRP